MDLLCLPITSEKVEYRLDNPRKRMITATTAD